MAETTTVQTPETTEAVPAPETQTKPTPERRSVPAQPAATVTETATHDPAEWRNHTTGEVVRVLKPEQRFADLHKGTEPLSMGRAIRSMLTGTWEGAEAEQRALSTTANPTAGILVPNPMAASVIDKARALSGLSRAGATTIPMDSSTLKIARVATDATMEVKSENTAFTGSDISFDAVELTAYTIGTQVDLSRELAEDAPNVVSIVEDKLARALAAKIDLYGMQGTGSAQPLGLTNMSGTNTTAVGGTLTYGSMLTALLEIEKDNYQPNAYLLSPTNADSLRQALVNSEVNHFATPPSAIAALTGVSTSGMPDATAAMGDFSQFYIGLRQGALVEVTTTGGDTWKNHQVSAKVTWRGAFVLADATAFTLLTGIA